MGSRVRVPPRSPRKIRHYLHFLTRGHGHIEALGPSGDTKSCSSPRRLACPNATPAKRNPPPQKPIPESLINPDQHGAIGRCTMRNDDFVSDGFLAVAGLVVLCPSLLAIAFM